MCISNKRGAVVMTVKYLEYGRCAVHLEFFVGQLEVLDQVFNHSFGPDCKTVARLKQTTQKSRCEYVSKFSGQWVME